MPNGVLWFVGAIAFAAFGVLLRFAVQALIDRSYRASAMWFFRSFLPLLIVCLVLVARGEPAVSELTRNLILGFVGAVIGGSITIWAGYAWLGTTADAQTNLPSSPPVTQNNQSGPNFVVPGSGNTFNINPPASTQVKNQPFTKRAQP